MKPRTRRILIVAGAIVGALVVLRVGLAFIWPTINDVSTGATPEYPDIQPQRFAKPADQVFAAALATARDMDLEITSQSPENGQIRDRASAKATSERMRGGFVTFRMHWRGGWAK